MAAKVYDRDAYLAQKREERRVEQEQKAARSAALQRQLRRERRIDGVKGFFSGVFGLLPSLAMYSSDSTLARQAIVFNAERAFAEQREMAAQQAALAEVQQCERDRRMARMIAEELANEADRRRGR